MRIVGNLRRQNLLVNVVSLVTVLDNYLSDVMCNLGNAQLIVMKIYCNAIYFFMSNVLIVYRQRYWVFC